MEHRPEESWITNALLVLGALGTLVGIGGWLLKDLLLLVSFVAGAGWALSIPLLVMLRRSWRELRARETEVADIRRQAEEWRTVATQDSKTLERVVAKAMEPPYVMPRRAHPHEAPDVALENREVEE
ncbi:hypothetical protein [Roseibium aggregatum]|uniref:hypothetical protein n=1 Tax=Roseibium aggregatum TaxID=187304 RepID=UPI001A8E538D|nr:hypothetical protein [Roseibium aggregatum]MBN8180074.1 hypothetical protein [Roseibium aggregatum]UES45764.1 hypothetical protein GFK90_19405 [Roseibium aggregatum]